MTVKMKKENNEEDEEEMVIEKMMIHISELHFGGQEGCLPLGVLMLPPRHL